MSEGFFSRWSRRKEAVREGKPVEPEPPPESSEEPSAQPAAPGEPAVEPQGQDPAEHEAAPPEPPPTLEDVQSLTPDSDFTRFSRPDVAPEVKNAAMKKLFTDPHFNRMDGLDVYIDDYGQPDPLPDSMARKLASAHFLKLFGGEEEKEVQAPAGAQGREVEHPPEPQTVAQSQPDEQAVPPPHQDADPDLRLQQDHAPGPPGPGQGTG